MSNVALRNFTLFSQCFICSFGIRLIIKWLVSSQHLAIYSLIFPQFSLVCHYWDITFFFQSDRDEAKRREPSSKSIYICEPWKSGWWWSDKLFGSLAYPNENGYSYGFIFFYYMWCTHWINAIKLVCSTRIIFVLYERSDIHGSS